MMTFTQVARLMATNNMRPLNSNDRSTFGGASDNALIGFTEDDALAIIFDVDEDGATVLAVFDQDGNETAWDCSNAEMIRG